MKRKKELVFGDDADLGDADDAVVDLVASADDAGDGVGGRTTLLEGNLEESLVEVRVEGLVHGVVLFDEVGLEDPEEDTTRHGHSFVEILEGLVCVVSSDEMGGRVFDGELEVVVDVEETLGKVGDSVLLCVFDVPVSDLPGVLGLGLVSQHPVLHLLLLLLKGRDLLLQFSDLVLQLLRNLFGLLELQLLRALGSGGLSSGGRFGREEAHVARHRGGAEGRISSVGLEGGEGGRGDVLRGRDERGRERLTKDDRLLSSCESGDACAQSSEDDLGSYSSQHFVLPACVMWLCAWSLL
mmetsp:Transcript_6290/g.10256  ORF Transcript_6290/g.10256 Transcript_6290/m.10256 type:complete len:297 (-) Transcript_6290:51-941(-)